MPWLTAHRFVNRCRIGPVFSPPDFALSVSAVSLYASSPSYFRGFTLIVLKEGKQGTSPDDYAGHFEVSG